jgi:hypothetical protein
MGSIKKGFNIVAIGAGLAFVGVALTSGFGPAVSGAGTLAGQAISATGGGLGVVGDKLVELAL